MGAATVRARARVRNLRSRYVNGQLWQLEKVRRRLKAGDVDVLLLGDSSVIFRSPDDEDMAPIPALISRELQGARVSTVVAGGFGALLHGDILRYLGTLDQRPKAVVLAESVRTNLASQVVRHPIYGYPVVREALARAGTANRPLNFLRRATEPTPEQYERFEEIEVQSRWSGTRTLGWYRKQLKGRGPRPWPPEVEALLFDFFHGEEVAPDNPGFGHCEELGRQVAAYGVPTVVYQTPVPVHRGELHYPGEFAEFAKERRHLVDSAIARYAGERLQFAGAEFVEADFIDSQDATEHLTLSGRSKIARAVAGLLDA